MRISAPSELEPLGELARLLGMSMSLIDPSMKILWASVQGDDQGPGAIHCYASKWGRSERCQDCLPVLVFRTGEPRSGWRERTPVGGAKTTLWVTAQPVRDMEGELRWVLESALPVTPAFSTSVSDAPRGGREGRLASAAGSPFLVVDASDRIVSWNPAASATFGYSLDEALGRRIDLLLPADKRSEKVWITERVREQGEVTRLRTDRLSRDGRRVPVLLSATALRDEAGELLGRSTVYEDLSAMEQLRRRVQAQDKLLAHINREAADGIIGFDPAGRVSSWNRGAQQTFGIETEDLLGRYPDRLLPREQLDALMDRVRREGTVRSLSMEWRDHTGRIIPVEVTATQLPRGDGLAQGVAAVVRDQSARQRLARQMIRSEKLAAVGSLAAGLAHEIGTPLNVISATVEFVLLDLDDDDPRRADLGSIVAETDRIGTLVRELLHFARGAPSPREPASVFEAASKVVRLIRVSAERRGVSLHCDLPADLPEVEVVPDELHQLLLNLLLNAVDAVPEGGRVVIEAELSMDVNPCGPGQVLFKVHDDGPGVGRELAERIFDPFFTTRTDGTGLGLAVCSRIVAEHGGDLRVTEGPLGGACFSVSLPCAAGSGS